MNITRRGFTLRLAGLLAAGMAGPTFGQDALRPFRSLSARLTGFAEDAIDPALALDMMENLQAAGSAAALDRLLEDEGLALALRDSGAADAAETELARRIAVAWFSGMHPDAAGSPSPAYFNALAWRALDYTKPPGQCAAAPAEWSDPPAGAVL